MRSLPTFKLDCDFKVKEFILQIRIKSPYTSGFYLDYQTLSCGEHFNGKHSVLLYDKNYGGQKIEMMLNNNTVTFDKPHAPYSEAVITYLNWMAIGQKGEKMNLKEQITKTDTLKNDLKLAKQKINDKILSGGGYNC